MISAKDANESTRRTNNAASLDQLKLIEDNIKRAANNGEYIIQMERMELLPSVKIKLKSLGYDVNVISDQRESYYATEISWL
jgi:exopolyphosphatase/pppGpp-phosphohydrolase